MPLIKKFWLTNLLTLIFVGMTVSTLYGQRDFDFGQEQSIEDAIKEQQETFQWPEPPADSEISEEQNSISESTFTEEAPPATYPKEENFLGDEIKKNLPPFSPQEKRTVEVPDLPQKPFVDAGDFRDPFFPVRGFQANSPEVLQPGVTVDGLQFFSYANSDKFVENYYRNTNFSLENVFGKVVQLEADYGCLLCHIGIEEISSNHQFKCTKCHAGNRSAKTLPAAHKGMVPNPSDLDHAGKFCGKCHAEQIAKMEQSPMTTAKGIINTTRYAWGAQPYEKGDFSLRPRGGGKEKPLPTAEKGHAVDSFLRTKCLRCHVQGASPHRPGDYRATGCAACHMVYGNDGLTLSRDRAIQSKQQKRFRENQTRFQKGHSSKSLENERGYPVMHKFTLAIPSVQCEHCHNANGVGNEFEGLLRKPARPKLNGSKVENEKPVLYGSEHEFLAPDIHRERGMHCIDCHGVNGIQGGGASLGLHSPVEIRCEDCHGTHSREPGEFLLIAADPNTKEVFKSIERNPNLKKKIRPGDIILVNSKGTKLPHIKRDKEQWVLFSKVTGKKHVIPILKNTKRPPAHQVFKHMTSMECHTCHARWSASDWGMHLIREPSLNLEKWKRWSFPDPTLQQLLSEKKPSTSPAKMLDWLTAKSNPEGLEGEKIDGVWWDIFTETSWKDMILGKNARGKYSVMKPRYQYFLTESNNNQSTEKRGAVPKTVDGKPGLILVPHTPHTIRKSVRTCESCHESRVALGLGDPLKRSIQDGNSFLKQITKNGRVPPEFQLKQVITDKGTALQTAVPPKKIRFMKPKELAVLTKKSDAYRGFRYLSLRSLQFPRLLSRNEYPYDLKHQANEKKYGSPASVEDLYYDFEKNRFFASGTSLADIIEQRIREEDTRKLTAPDSMPEFQQEISGEPGPEFPEPVMELPVPERFSDSSEPTLPLPEPALENEQILEVVEPLKEVQNPEKEQSLEEEGNTIIEFFKGIFEEGSPQTPITKPNQPNTQ